MHVTDKVLIEALRGQYGISFPEAKEGLTKYKEMTAKPLQDQRTDAMAMYLVLLPNTGSSFEHTALRVACALKAFNEVF